MAPWRKLHILVEPVYPKIMGAGRPRTGLAPMLRMHLVQQCFGSSDEVIDDAIYDSQTIRTPVGFDVGRENASDATTLLKFRRLLETKELTRQIFKTISRHLAEKSLMVCEETVIDATLIAAPPSAKKRRLG